MRLMAFPKTNLIHQTITTLENNENSVNQLYIRQQTTTNDYSRLQTFNQRLFLDKLRYFAASNLYQLWNTAFQQSWIKTEGKRKHLVCFRIAE